MEKVRENKITGEKDANEFMTKFMNDNSYDIREIMNWSDEIEINCQME